VGRAAGPCGGAREGLPGAAAGGRAQGAAGSAPEGRTRAPPGGAGRAEAGRTRATGGGGCVRVARGTAQGRVQGGRAGEEGVGEGKRERGRGELTSGSKSGDHRLQNLGHHGEREREREVAARENSMRGKDQGRGHAWGGHGRQGRAGRAGSRRVGLGWAAPRVKTPWHAQPQIGIQSAKQNMKRD
jgi:hypothetical protein